MPNPTTPPQKDQSTAPPLPQPKPRTRLPDSPIPRTTSLTAADTALLFGPNHYRIATEMPETEFQKGARLDIELRKERDRNWHNANNKRKREEKKAKAEAARAEQRRLIDEEERELEAEEERERWMRARARMSVSDSEDGDDDVVVLHAQFTCELCKAHYQQVEDLTGHMWEVHQFFPKEAVDQGLLGESVEEGADMMDAAQALIQLSKSS